MSSRTPGLTAELYEYLLGILPPEPAVLRELREDSAGRPGHHKQISPEQAGLMALLVELVGARRVLEIGTFRGYSALAMALALPADGALVTCDVSAEETASARRFWERAGVAGRIDLRLGPALETLDGLLAGGSAEGTFDLAFIDADKHRHDAYYERALRLVRRGGLVLLDNVLWQGRVVDPAWADDRDTQAIRALNAKLRDDDRVRVSPLPVGDGLTLALRR